MDTREWAPAPADLRSMSEQQMAALGWVPAARVGEARARERERCRAVLRERLEHVGRFAQEIAPVNPGAAQVVGAEVVALRRAIDLLADPPSPAAEGG